MELRHLRYFVTAAEERSVSRAAARMNISQPAVSRQLRDLENELGVKLFLREPQGLRLTESGETALLHAKDLLRRAKVMEAALKRLSVDEGRQLRVGFIPTALPGILADGMRRFNERPSGVCVQIREMSPREQEAALRAGEIDLALMGNVCPELKREFETTPILKTPLSVVLPDRHLLALRKSIDLADLAGESFVSLHERHFPGRPELIRELSERAGFAIDVAVKADGLSEALGMVAGGAGVAALPADVDQLPHPGVVFVKMRSPRVYLTSSAAWRKRDADPEIPRLVRLLKQAAQRT